MSYFHAKKLTWKVAALTAAEVVTVNSVELVGAALTTAIDEVAAPPDRTQSIPEGVKLRVFVPSIQLAVNELDEPSPVTVAVPFR